MKFLTILLPVLATAGSAYAFSTEESNLIQPLISGLVEKTALVTYNQAKSYTPPSPDHAQIPHLIEAILVDLAEDIEDILGKISEILTGSTAPASSAISSITGDLTSSLPVVFPTTLISSTGSIPLPSSNISYVF